MPADTSASEYHWYMNNVAEDQRVVRFKWVPDGVFASSMSTGRLTLETRDDPRKDDWVEGKVFQEMPWVVAQNLARGQGFGIEVPYGT